MDWKEFFKLKVYKNSKEGPLPYFQTELMVAEAFLIEEMSAKLFKNWNLSEKELKKITYGQRKILLRHQYFNSREFDRIAQNFKDRIKTEKDRELFFSCHGGGVYLFLTLLKDPAIMGKFDKIVCYTSEIPLDVMHVNLPTKHPLKLVYRPEIKSQLDDLPGAWENSPYLKLFEIDESDSEVASA